MPNHPLRLAPRRPRPCLTLHRDIALPLGRMHEACGAARYTFAMWLAGQTCGPVLWISPLWQADQPNPDGMHAFVDPGRFIFVTPRRGEDLLWCTEEALRAGAAPLVVTDLPGAPALTPVRRLHLAAQSGGELGHAPPLGLLLTPGEGGAQGVETRWYMAPAHTGENRQWHLERRRARALPPQTWSATQTRARAGLELTRQSAATKTRTGPEEPPVRNAGETRSKYP
jgi:protein ImuA